MKIKQRLIQVDSQIIGSILSLDIPSFVADRAQMKRNAETKLRRYASETLFADESICIFQNDESETASIVVLRDKYVQMQETVWI